MAILKLIQAEYGDCLILNYEDGGTNKNMLIDGGPSGTYPSHLKAVLKHIASNNEKLEYLVLSHIDTDHITGILDLLYELEYQRDNGEIEMIKIDNIWANTFEKTIGYKSNIRERFQNAMSGVLNMEATMSHASAEILGVNQGNKLRIQAAKLNIPLNDEFRDDLIHITKMDHPQVRTGEITIKIIGPLEENLDELKAEWKDWLDKYEEELASGNFSTMSNADKSIPNLSSIMFLIDISGKSILMTGDGRSDHIYSGLKEADLLNNGRLHVHILKMPHHGSDRNMTRWFLDKVTADKYIISANGKHSNPDLSTLIWLVESAKDRGSKIELILTNETLSSKKLLNEYPIDIYGYTLTIMPDHYHYFDIEI